MRVAVTKSFEFPLSSPGRAEAFLALAALLAFGGSAEALKIARVASLGKSLEASAVRKGLALDPDNADLHDRLSQLEGDSLSASNLADSVAQARRANVLNPNKYAYWLDLASACESLGDSACVEQALDRALVLCPMAPRVWWAAGNQYLRINQPDKAARCFQRLLWMNPEYAGPTFDLTLRAYGDPEMIYQKVVGDGAGAQQVLAFADVMSANDQFDAAQQAWRRVEGSGAKFSFAAAQPYLEHLLRRGRYQEAQSIWLQLERQGVIGAPANDQRGNLVFNGGFEAPPLNAGFDWRLQPSPYVSVDFADASPHEGLHCLRVDFPVSQNNEFEPVYQVLPVVAGHTYTLAAYVRTNEVTSDSGPRLKVVDPDCSTCMSAFTESTTGTTGWHAVSVKFTTGKQTRAIRVSVWRPRSRTFPMDIWGSFWLDDVSIRSINPSLAE